MKTKNAVWLAIVALPLMMQTLAYAENLRTIDVDNNASYALDTDSIVKSNGRTAFSVQTIYTSKMIAPNSAIYIRATNTFLADCKAETQALTGVVLFDGTGKIVFTDNPTVQQAPMIKPERNSLSAKIMQAVCSAK